MNAARLMVLSGVLWSCAVEAPQTVAQSSECLQKTSTGVCRPIPNVMLLVDHSGSMSQPMDPTGGTVTRASELKRAAHDFLASSGARARLGLTAFPTDAICGSPSGTSVALPASDDPDVLRQNAELIEATVQSLEPMGGTPIADALELLAREPSLNDPTRDNFIVLLTDGVPNCNGQNPSRGTSSCRCTVPNCTGPFDSLGCLDDARAVAAVQALRQRGIRTAVIGFGAELVGGDAPAVLQAMALAGDFTRHCASGDEHDCERAWHHAMSGDALNAALTRVCDEAVAPPGAQ
jgi:hypothetical protein